MDKNIDNLFKEALFVCEYGSSVYGCSSKQSDKDYVVLLDDLHVLWYKYIPKDILSFNNDKIQCHLINESIFINLLNEAHPMILECLFTKNVIKGKSIIKDLKDYFLPKPLIAMLKQRKN